MTHDKLQIPVNGPKAWLLAARPKTLTGAVAPVLVGAALAWNEHGMRLLHSSGWVAVVLCALFALVMQIDANFVNDYFDFKKGTDRADRLGPERACAQGWVTPRAMMRAIIATTVAGCAVGLPLVWFGGWWMLLVGAVCVVAAVLYTTYLSYRGWGDVMVLLFFGLVPVVFSYACATAPLGGACWTRALILGAGMGLVTDCLLMVNNYRDVEQDRVSGKRTVVVRFGPKVALALYLCLGVAGCVAVVMSEPRNPYLALMLLYLLLHQDTWHKMASLSGRDLNRVLGQTARNIFIYGVLVALLLCL